MSLTTSRAYLCISNNTSNSVYLQVLIHIFVIHRLETRLKHIRTTHVNTIFSGLKSTDAALRQTSRSLVARVCSGYIFPVWKDILTYLLQTISLYTQVNMQENTLMNIKQDPHNHENHCLSLLQSIDMICEDSVEKIVRSTYFYRDCYIFYLDQHPY